MMLLSTSLTALLRHHHYHDNQHLNSYHIFNLYHVFSFYLFFFLSSIFVINLLNWLSNFQPMTFLNFSSSLSYLFFIYLSSYSIAYSLFIVLGSFYLPFFFSSSGKVPEFATSRSGFVNRTSLHITVHSFLNLVFLLSLSLLLLIIYCLFVHLFFSFFF